MQAQKVAMPIILGLGLITLTGCGTHGDSQGAENVAEQFVKDNMNLTHSGFYFPNVNSHYDWRNGEWTVTGTVESHDLNSTKADNLVGNTFTVYETTNDGENWSNINTVIH